MQSQIRQAMQRIFGDAVCELDIDREEMPLLASGTVPADVAALVSSLEEDDYFNGAELTGSENQLLYGAYGFEESNGDDGVLSGLIEAGGLPRGTYEIGEHLLVDSSGSFPGAQPGAVYAVGSDYDLEVDCRRVATSILDLLTKIPS